ncbi:hypothetical protein P4O66_018817 [Electrophorus voltai]|uniref:Uncharacterized protein n=1 Tax=Electrophorus voltai TaxID=2609070 RepID=A0AAD9DLQ5_9TELE|nr:hypothetical protein P4O66_018817 [Electrophorus voltai]
MAEGMSGFITEAWGDVLSQVAERNLSSGLRGVLWMGRKRGTDEVMLPAAMVLGNSSLSFPAMCGWDWRWDDGYYSCMHGMLHCQDSV